MKDIKVDVLEDSMNSEERKEKEQAAQRELEEEEEFE